LDTGYDFIQPEFFNVLFFQQKNLVIYPYVDLKHLHSLEIFANGYNVINLESTALHNLREILEFENGNSYSHQPTLYFIYNLDSENLKEIISLKNIRCILNTHEDVEHLATENSFIFYNKKIKSFVNFDSEAQDLEFEQLLISRSENEAVLQDEIQRIKAISTRIFTIINESNDVNEIVLLLEEYDKKYWKKILNFVKLYFKIEVPELSKLRVPSTKRFSNKPTKFSSEYEFILKKNSKIGQEFIQLLHDYRSKKVNPSNLELDQLYNPHKLYDYLRDHHWDTGITKDFLSEWIQMNNTKYKLNDNDLSDFLSIFRYLKIPESNITELQINRNETFEKNEESKLKSEPIHELSTQMSIPSINNFYSFKDWLLKKLDDLDKSI